MRFQATMELPSEDVLARVESGRTEHEKTAAKVGASAPEFKGELLPSPGKSSRS